MGQEGQFGNNRKCASMDPGVELFISRFALVALGFEGEQVERGRKTRRSLAGFRTLTAYLNRSLRDGMRS